MLLTAKKAPGSSLPSPDRRESPRPDYFVVLFFFFLRISMFLFPKETRISPPKPGTVTGCLARRLRSGRFFFPFEREKINSNLKTNYKRGRDSSACGCGAGLDLPPRSRAVQPHLTPMPLRAALPGPARSLEKRDTETRLFNGKTSTNNVKLSMDEGRIVCAFNDQK